MVFVETISTDFITLNNGLTKLRKKHNKTINLRYAALIYVKVPHYKYAKAQETKTTIPHLERAPSAGTTTKLFRGTTGTFLGVNVSVTLCRY